MNTVNVFISLPMNGKSKEEIEADIERASEYITHLTGDSTKVHIMDTMIHEDYDSPIKYLGESIKILADADIVLMARGWEEARGCRIEYQVAKEYSICVIKEA